MNKSTLFPIFIKTEEPFFLVVGGGNVGLEKVQTLLKQNKNIKLKIISKEFKSEFQDIFLSKPHICWEKRSFTESDLDDVNFLFLATNQTTLNKEIKKIANQRKILVNAADQPELCDFYLGSIISKENLKIAISTNGKSPVLARRLREHLEQEIPDNIENTLENLNFFRNQHKGNLEKKLNDLNTITSNLITKSS